jgi:hypothetical protein
MLAAGQSGGAPAAIVRSSLSHPHFEMLLLQLKSARMLAHKYNVHNGTVTATLTASAA